MGKFNPKVASEARMNRIVCPHCQSLDAELGDIEDDNALFECDNCGETYRAYREPLERYQENEEDKPKIEDRIEELEKELRFANRRIDWLERELGK